MPHTLRITILLIIGLATVAAVIWLPRSLAAVAVAGFTVFALWMLRAPAAPGRREQVEDGASVDDALQPLQDLVRLLDPLREGVLLLGDGQVVLAANQSAARILGRSPEQVTGVSLIRASRDHELVQLLRESSGLLNEISIADGTRVLAYATPFELGPVQTLLTLQDVTALRRAERARQDLVANVSHELRTPIAAALALAETLEGGVDDPEQAARFHQRLTGELERLKEIVERLLRLSRIESEAEEFHFRTLVLDALIHEVMERVAPVAGREQVALAFDGGAQGLQVRGDEDRVSEVLSNLLDNAIRFSPPGSTITIAAGTVEGMAQVSVRDQGPGILPSDRTRIFERFYTGDAARTTNDDREGTGLGLAIARHIVSRHGGQIWVSDETPGATICFTLPLVHVGSAAGGAAQ